MFIKVVTVKVKPRHQRAKKSYKYVRVVDRCYGVGYWGKREKVIATLGPLESVRRSADILVRGLKNLPGG